MSKTTNKQQLEVLLNLMQMHPDIARGFYKGNREELNRFWSKAEEELNSLGPPSKNVSEWKKVWADQKKYVRHKAAQNLKARKGTGGGPNVEQRFSATEESIYNLIGMKESVEGVANTFGLTASCNIVKKTPQNSLPIVFDVVQLQDEIFDELTTYPAKKYRTTQPLPTQKVSAAEDEELDEPTSYHTPAKKYRKTQPLPAQKLSTADVLVEEISIQKDIRDVMKDQQQNTKRIYRSIDRLFDLQKHHFEQIEKSKKEELEEMKRHNLVMEKLRMREVEDKIEKNRKLLEIEDIKQRI